MSPNETVTTDEALRELLRAARGQQGFSQRQVAHRAKLSPSWYHRVESAAEPRVSVSALLRILTALSISPKDLRTLRGVDGVPWEGLAKELERWKLHAIKQGPYEDEMENYIHQGPADSKTKIALVAAYRAVRTARGNCLAQLQDEDHGSS